MVNYASGSLFFSDAEGTISSRQEGWAGLKSFVLCAQKCDELQLIGFLASFLAFDDMDPL